MSDVDSAKVVRYTVQFVLRWTAGALLFGTILEALLSLGRQPYRLEVPLLMTLAVFGLSLAGSILAIGLVVPPPLDFFHKLPKAEG